MWFLTAAEVAPLAAGAAVLGSGGGGSTAVAGEVAAQALQVSGPVPVSRLPELAADDLVVPLGLVGAVTVFEEKPPSGDEWQVLIDAVEHYAGRRIRALMPFEAAGVNALLPVAAASQTGRPLVDADVMGRAFTGLDQTVLTLNALPATPMVLANEQGAITVIDRVNAFQAERLARAIVVTMGGWAVVAFAPQPAQALARHAIHGSMSRAVRYGQRVAHRDLSGLLQAAGGRSLFRGKVIEVERDTATGYGRGSLVLEHLNDRSRLLTVEFQNENLVAVEQGEVLAVVPDLICTLRVEDLTAVTTEQFKYGLELEIVRIPAPAQWRTTAGLGLVGPSAFGYRTPYVVAGHRRDPR